MITIADNLLRAKEAVDAARLPCAQSWCILDDALRNLAAAREVYAPHSAILDVSVAVVEYARRRHESENTAAEQAATAYHKLHRLWRRSRRTPRNASTP